MWSTAATMAKPSSIIQSTTQSTELTSISNSNSTMDGLREMHYPLNSTCPITKFLPQEDIVYVYIIPTITFVGIVFNVLSLSVLRLPRFDSSVFTYLYALAAADLMTCLFVFPIGFIRLALNLISSEGQQNTVKCTHCHGTGVAELLRRLYDRYFMVPLNNMSSTVSDFIVVVVAFERLCYIQWPISSRPYCTRRIARRVIGVICLAAILLNVHYFLLYEIGPGDCYVVSESRIAKENKQLLLIWGFVWTAIVLFLPLCTLFVLNTILMIKLYKVLRQAKRKRSSTSVSLINREKAQNRVTITLICKVCVYIVGKSPVALLVPGIAKTVFGSTKSISFKNYVLVANVLIVSCYATNFLIFFACNNRFRGACANHILMRILQRLHCNSGGVGGRIYRWLRGRSRHDVGTDPPATFGGGFTNDLDRQVRLVNVLF